MNKRMATKKLRDEKRQTRGERFVAGFVGGIVLMGIGFAVSLGFSWLLWRYGPFVAFPSIVVPLAVLAGLLHAAGADSPTPVHKDQAE